ncbi:MAG: RtcB family protein [Patescibacteria group bacterium]|nr:RtcB family protein [Patescibacteria group bacterium]
MDIKQLKRIEDYLYEIPADSRRGMLVPARIYATARMLEEISSDSSLDQLINVAALPGIQKYALAMPDIHEGYGFPIGGVAAMDFSEGVVSPGGVGYDINCGVRLLRSGLKVEEISEKLKSLAHQISRDVPSGVGRGGEIVLTPEDLDEVLKKGVKRLLELGWAEKNDLENIEENGCMKNADPEAVSAQAKKRGRDQLGTLGSGNHFLEIQAVDQIYDEPLAKELGIETGRVMVMIHTGSRGLGHQVCTDYVKIMAPKLAKWGIELPDRELACAPISSPEGKSYLAAMAAAANFAWSNRQMITHLIRNAWKRILEPAGLDPRLDTVYDVAHNIAKIEEHIIKDKKVKLCVHRKGATRAFGPGRPELNELYRRIGQPVLIPGTMGTSSYLLMGTEMAEKTTFGTVCHGAGRRMSRHEAKRRITGPEVRKELESRGIIVECASSAGLAEEAPLAYKDVDEVVDVVVRAGLAKRVAKLKPIAVIKGG